MLLHSFLVILAAVCFCLPAEGQIYRNRVDPQWSEDGHWFWYRIQTGPSQYEFVIADTQSATRTPAFDHRLVADQLSQQLKRNITPESLPVRTLKFEDGRQKIILVGKDGRWSWDVQSQKLHPLKADAGSRNPFFLQSRRSAQQGEELQLEIRNQLNVDVELAWVDRSGRSQAYGTIPAGDKRRQHTFEGHIWKLQPSDSQSPVFFEATISQPEVEITAAAIQKAASKITEPRRSRRNRSRGRSFSQRTSRNGRIFVKGDNLWFQPTGSPAFTLTDDATAQNTFRRTNGRKTPGSQVESDSDRESSADIRWANDGNTLIAFQTEIVDDRIVSLVLSSPKDQLQPRLQQFSYTKPGDPLPKRRLRLFHASTQTEIPVSNDLFSNPYSLRFLKFSDDSKKAWLLYNQRGHQVVRIIEIDTTNGAVRTIVEEQTDTFIHYSNSGKLVNEWLGEERLIWASERSGWNHLYLYDVKSGQTLNPITSGSWNVKKIESIDRDRQQIWFYAVGVHPEQDPYHEHFCRVNFDGSDLTVLTDGDGTHSIQMSPNRKTMIDRWSRVDQPHVTEVRDCQTGQRLILLEEADANAWLASGGQYPVRFAAPGRNGKTMIYGIIHFPTGYDRHLKYPVVENIYAGPHDHHVPKSFQTSYRHQRKIADRGAIVVQIDGMGTAWRSKDFHDVCWQNLADAGFPDRIKWIKAAAEKYPAMDLDRVGIYGGSAGGQNAMAALLWHGHFYKVAVADCGCHDNRMDKIWWNEQWMGWPIGDHYSASSNVDNAHRLQGKLLLIVGENDRNVDPASTMQVVDALIKADKDFDLLVMPGVGHGAAETRYGSRRRTDFLSQHLKFGKP